MLSRAAVGLLGQCEVVGVVNMTQGESLDSEILGPLHTQTIVDVLEVGGSGRVFALAHGKEGWLSLSSKHGEQLLRKLKMEQVEELEEIEEGADDSAKTPSGYDGVWDRLRDSVSEGSAMDGKFFTNLPNILEKMAFQKSLKIATLVN